MMALNINYEEEVLKILKTLDTEKKQQVLNFAKNVSSYPKAISRQEFLDRTKHIYLSDADAHEMMSAISDAFDTIDDIEVNFDE